MDDEQKAVNEDLEVENEIVESPPTEQEATQTEAPVEDAQEEVSDSPKEEKTKPVEKRIHKLVEEREREKAEKESLAKQVEDLTEQLSSKQEGLPQVPTVEPGSEITPEQYKEDLIRTAQSIAQLEVQRQRIIDTINKEAYESMQDHPELNPKSGPGVFDKELSETITEAVKAQVQANPTASVKKLVNNLMKPYRRAVDKQVAETTEAITKQVSESALRPSQVRGEEKPFEDLTPEEMEKKLGVVY